VTGDDLDAEDLDAVGYRRAFDDGWSFRSIEREIGSISSKFEDLNAGEREALAPAPRRRTRKPSLESQVRQMHKAGQAAGVPLTLTVEGGTVTASPAKSFRQAEPSEPEPDDEVEAWIKRQAAHAD
jgi:hypothetical protein